MLPSNTHPGPADHRMLFSIRVNVIQPDVLLWY